MSTVETAQAQGEKAATEGLFVKDANGRTIFYPSGVAWSGYVVPNAEREQALHAAWDRYLALSKQFTPWGVLLVPFILFPFYTYLSSRPLVAVGSFVLAIVLIVLIGALFKQYQLRDALAELERVHGTDRKPQRSLAILALSLAAAFTAVELIGWFYQWRLDALPVAPGTTIYYNDISLPLTFALICGGLFFMFVFGWRKLVDRFGDQKILMCLLVFTIVAFWCAGYVVMNFLDPKPYVVIAQNDLLCKWSVRWSDVRGIDLTTGRHGRRYASLETGPQSQSVSWLGGNGKRCEISGLNEDYTVVYQSIRAAWQDARLREKRPK